MSHYKNKAKEETQIAQRKKYERAQRRWKRNGCMDIARVYIKKALGDNTYEISFSNDMNRILHGQVKMHSVTFTSTGFYGNVTAYSSSYITVKQRNKTKVKMTVTVDNIIKIIGSSFLFKGAIFFDVPEKTIPNSPYSPSWRIPAIIITEKAEISEEKTNPQKRSNPPFAEILAN